MFHLKSLMIIIQFYEKYLTHSGVSCIQKWGGLSSNLLQTFLYRLEIWAEMEFNQLTSTAVQLYDEWIKDAGRMMNKTINISVRCFYGAFKAYTNLFLSIYILSLNLK